MRDIFLNLKAATEIEAPFGFVWNQTKSELISKGFVLTECNDSQEIPVESCTLKTSPKKYSKADFFSLIFAKNKGLQKVSMLGKDIKNDPYGSSGKEQYRSLSSSLAKKYGEPSDTFEWTGRDLYKDSDEFYECLNYQNCGSLTSYWLEGTEGTITLDLRGVSRGAGFIKLTYESKRWSDILDKFNSEKSAGDEDSL